jgi:beta-1,4-N-acetylglucosaminyltransferase
MATVASPATSAPHQSSSQRQVHASTPTSSDPMPTIPGRKCFVTVGATASFRQLLAAVLRPDFLKSLTDNGFDRLEVQCGPEADLIWFRQAVSSLGDVNGLDIECFSYSKDLMSSFLECRAERVDGVQRRLAGCVISHAGKPCHT